MSLEFGYRLGDRTIVDATVHDAPFWERVPGVETIVFDVPRTARADRGTQFDQKLFRTKGKHQLLLDDSQNDKKGEMKSSAGRRYSAALDVLCSKNG